jgi:hypothetical protein
MWMLIDPNINIVNLLYVLRGKNFRGSPYSIFFPVVKQKNLVGVLRSQIDIMRHKDNRQMLFAVELTQ